MDLLVSSKYNPKISFTDFKEQELVFINLKPILMIGLSNSKNRLFKSPKPFGEF